MTVTEKGPRGGLFAIMRGGSAGDRVPRDAADVFAANAEIAQFTIRHAAEFVDGLTILAPVVEGACYVHDDPLS